MRGQVDGHADVADAGRERARPGGWRSRRSCYSQPAPRRRPSSRTAGLKRSTWPTWTGTPRAAAAATIRERLVDGGRQRLLDEDGDAALDRRQGERHVGRRRRRDDDARRGPPRRSSPSGSAKPAAPVWAAAAAPRASATGSATATSRHARAGRGGRGDGCGPSSRGRPARPGARGSPAGARCQAGPGHRPAARSGAASRPWRARPAAAARAADDGRLLVVGQARVHRQGQAVRRRPRSVTGRSAVDAALQDVRLAMDRDRVVDADADAGSPAGRRRSRRGRPRRRSCTGGRRGVRPSGRDRQSGSAGRRSASS